VPEDRPSRKDNYRRRHTGFDRSRAEQRGDYHIYRC